MTPIFPPYPWRAGDRAWCSGAWHEVIDTDGYWCRVALVGRTGRAVSKALPNIWLSPGELPSGTVVRQRFDGLEWRVGREPLVGVWDPEFGTYTVDVLAWPPRCGQCGLFGHERCVTVPWRPGSFAKGPDEGATLCKRCGRDRILVANRRGRDFNLVHGGPCEPVRACGHRDELEARWFEDGKWHGACRECAAPFAPEEG